MLQGDAVHVHTYILVLYDDVTALMSANRVIDVHEIRLSILKFFLPHDGCINIHLAITFNND